MFLGCLLNIQFFFQFLTIFFNVLDVVGRFGMFWDILGRFVRFWDVYGCFGAYGDILWRSGTFRDVLEH